MALLLQPHTALPLSSLSPNTSLGTPFHHPATSAASPKPCFPHCHSLPYATATPFSPHFPILPFLQQTFPASFSKPLAVSTVLLLWGVTVLCTLGLLHRDMQRM